MSNVAYVLDIFLHLDRYLIDFVAAYGTWTYLVVIGVIFCETGLVIMPFLPGDSLLFALGAIAAHPQAPLNIFILLASLVIASFVGNQVNYVIGKWFGEYLITKNPLGLIKKQNLVRAHGFYEEYGGKTIILARFMPIIRTFAPFVAGISEMHWKKFTGYNASSAVLWIASLLGAGYFFGALPWISAHFTVVIYSIVIISLLPSLIAVLRSILPVSYKKPKSL